MKLPFLLLLLSMSAAVRAQVAAPIAPAAPAAAAPTLAPIPTWWTQYAPLKTKEATLAQLVAADASLTPEALDALPADGPVHTLKTKSAVQSFSAAGRSFTRLLRSVDLKKTEYGKYKLNWDPVQESNGYYYQCSDNGLVFFYVQKSAKKADRRVFLHFVPHAG